MGEPRSPGTRATIARGEGVDRRGGGRVRRRRGRRSRTGRVGIVEDPGHDPQRPGDDRRWVTPGSAAPGPAIVDGRVSHRRSRPEVRRSWPWSSTIVALVLDDGGPGPRRSWPWSSTMVALVLDVSRGVPRAIVGWEVDEGGPGGRSASFRPCRVVRVGRRTPLHREPVDEDHPALGLVVSGRRRGRVSQQAFIDGALAAALGDEVRGADAHHADGRARAGENRKRRCPRWPEHRRRRRRRSVVDRTSSVPGPWSCSPATTIRRSRRRAACSRGCTSTERSRRRRAGPERAWPA